MAGSSPLFAFGFVGVVHSFWGGFLAPLLKGLCMFFFCTLRAPRSILAGSSPLSFSTAVDFSHAGVISELMGGFLALLFCNSLVDFRAGSSPGPARVFPTLMLCACVVQARVETELDSEKYQKHCSPSESLVIFHGTSAYFEQHACYM